MIDYRMIQLIEMALDEDRVFNDISSLMLLKFDRQAKARLICKDEGILSGSIPFSLTMQIVSAENRAEFFKKDGEKISKGEIIAIVKGKTSAILRAERTALNFIQHLSGIATETARIAGKLNEFGITLLDTRKTLPGIRYLQKKAVMDGGGRNHRLNLSEMALIKDNHIAMVGSLTKAFRELCRFISPEKIEVEVKSLSELNEALQAGAKWVMLDNFQPEMIQEAIKIVNRQAKIEVSGKISAKNLDQFLIKGIDFISMGYLTHSVRALDLSLEVSNE